MFRSLASLLVLFTASNVTLADAKRDALWSAVRANDVAAVKAAVEKGTDVNARNEYGVTALWIAAEKGNPDVIKLLVEKGADVNARDDIWYVTPLTASVTAKPDIVRLLIRAGANDADAAIISAAAANKEEIVRAILDSTKVGQEALDAALDLATGDSKAKVREASKRPGPNRCRRCPKPSAKPGPAWSASTRATVAPS